MPKPSPAPVKDERLPFEQLVEARGTPAWLAAAVKAGERLAVGALLTPDEFDRLVERTLNHRFGY